MKKNKIHTSLNEYEVVIPHNELETIVANAMRVSEDAPMMPALKLTFLKDFTGGMIVKGNWKEEA